MIPEYSEGRIPAATSIPDAISEISKVLILERQNYSNDAQIAFDLATELALAGRVLEARPLYMTGSALRAKAEALVDIHGPIMSVFAHL